MNKTAIAAAALLIALAAPAATQAKPTSHDRANAAQACRAERGSTPATREAFKARYGTNANGRNAFGKCVSTRARKQERQRRAARAEAVADCREEARELGPAEFAAKYGTGPKRRNAHGRCVSAEAREELADADEDDREDIAERKRAAKRCAAERRSIGTDAFARKYGTNRNHRNAFGKCVSRTVRDDHDDRGGDDRDD